LKLKSAFLKIFVVLPFLCQDISIFAKIFYPIVMSLLVVGTVALDTIETPFGKAERIIGGSATHFALAASFIKTFAWCL
jgi:hypothetical protein